MLLDIICSFPMHKHYVQSCLIIYCYISETLCPENTYGLSCTQLCNCDLSELCNLVTGNCTEGCQKGTYGFLCNNTCSSNCLGSNCLSRTGMCVDCPPGYIGDVCSEGEDFCVCNSVHSLLNTFLTVYANFSSNII